MGFFFGWKEGKQLVAGVFKERHKKDYQKGALGKMKKGEGG